MKKILSICLIATMILTNAATISHADSLRERVELHDSKGHWAASVIEKWMGVGVVTGYKNGEFRPDNKITRAEFTVIINRLFRSSGTRVSFTDVDKNAWYADSISAGSAAGYIAGYPDGTFKPNEELTRADAALILGRAFQYQDSGFKTNVLDVFQDHADIPSYAQPFVKMLVSAGVIAGYHDGTFRPEKKVTRAETVQWIDRLAGQLFNQEGIYDGQGSLANAIVNTPGIVLRDKQITGNLYLAQGIGDGDVRVEKSKVEGRVFVNGGGVNSVYVTDSDLESVKVNRQEAPVRLVVDRGSSVKEMEVHSAAKLQNESAGGIDKVVINTSDAYKEGVTLLGKFPEVIVNFSSSIVVDQHAEVEYLTTTATAENARLQITGQVGELRLNKPAMIELDEQATVKNLILDKGVTAASIQGNGFIENISVLEEGAAINGMAADSNKEYSWKSKLEESRTADPTSKDGGGGNSGGEIPLSWAPVAAAGATHGTAKVSAPVAAGNQMAVTISHEPIPTPLTGSVLAAGSTFIYPYQPNSDISGVDAVTNKYLGIYEVDSNRKVVRFREIVLSSSQIQSETWKLAWNDEFNGESIDETKWNYVQGGGGYGNNELQYYTNRTNNARVENGQLVIEAHKEAYGGNPYTSAKLTTEGKGDWTYGKFEVRAKMPHGQGIWPAIWMMPTDENLYSGWPASGEIDMMELLGHQPNKIYGTLHYGVPHGSSQGTYTLPGNESFADRFHTFAVEWEPGEFRFYVDGILYSKMQDWYSKNTQEGGNYTYPAPFDRDFFMQLNLAVGGNWPGNPDESTVFSQKMLVDYVRVYELDGGQYRRPVEPSKGEPAIIREPGADGNYVMNGGFDSGVQNGWVFQPFAPPADLFGGSGTVTLDQGALKTDISSEGNETYAIQLVQANMPIVKGSTYQLSFDAWSNGERTMVVDLSGPERNYTRYLQDQTLQLTGQKKTYTFTFTMQSETDPNGRLEFNMGKAGSLPVWLDNVRLVKTAEADPNQARDVLPSGNYVYNGTFDQGPNRLGFWSIGGSRASEVSYGVGSAVEDRKLYMQSEAAGEAHSLVLSQDRMKLIRGKTYVVSFDAKADTANTIEVQLRSTNQSLEYGTKAFAIGQEKKNYSAIFTMNHETDPYSKIEFKLGSLLGKLELDNIMLKEMAPPVAIQGVKRVEAENYSDMQGVQKGADGLSVGWIDPGDWMQFIVDVQQPGPYTVSYFVASGYEGGGSLTLMSKSGSVYTGELPVGEILEADAEHKYELAVPNTGDWGAFTLMHQEIQLNSGIQTLQIYAPHLNVDYMIFTSQNQAGRLQNVIRNGTFDTNVSEWTTYQSDKMSITADQGSMKVQLPTLTPNVWDQQVYQDGLTLQQGVTYTISFEAKSTAARPIKLGVGNIDPNNNYAFTDYLNGSSPLIWLTTESKPYSYSFVMNHATDMNAKLEFDMGQLTVDGVVYDVGGDVYLDNIRLSGSIIQNGLFDTNADHWNAFWGDQWNGQSSGSLASVNGELEIAINSTGIQNWNPQISQDGIALEQGKKYLLSFDARAEGDRKMNVGIGKKLEADPWNIAYFGIDVPLSEVKQHYTFTFTMSGASEDNARIDFNVGKFDDSGSEVKDIFLDNVVLVEIK